MTKAEDQVMSVGAASIIARYIFLTKMHEMNQNLGMIIPLGAGDLVDKGLKGKLKGMSLKNAKKYASNFNPSKDLIKSKSVGESLS